MNEMIEQTADEAAETKNTVAIATEKIAKELKTFKGGNKETAVSKFVASTITHFCEQSEKFAAVVAKTPRTLSDCCAEIMSGVGTSVSDIDVYRKAVKHYFPDSEVHMTMEIITGEVPPDEEVNRPPKVKVAEPRKTKKEAKPSEEKARAERPSKPAKPSKPVEAAEPEIIQLSMF